MTIFRADERRAIHLSDRDVSLLRSLLLCQLAEHADQAAGCRATVDDLTLHQRSDSMIERDIAQVSASHFETIVQEVKAALARLDDGSYGVCEHCDGPIPYDRLEAIPEARRCVRCSDSTAGRLT